ncbi:MAG: ABC transporter permease [Planctomycetota bacterium]
MMRLLDGYPGIALWRLGERLIGSLYFSVFTATLATGILRSGMIAGIFAHAARKLSEGGVPFTGRHVDVLVSSVLLLLLLAALFVASRAHHRRALRKKGEEILDRGHWAVVIRQFKRNRLAVVGLYIILLLYLVALFCPFYAPHDPLEMGHKIRDRLLEPSAGHLLGTDKFARDVFSRIVYGSRISLLVGFLAVGMAVGIGTIYGAIAGYYGRWVESIMMRFVDMLLSFPTLVLIITIIAIFRKQSIWVIIGVIGLVSWTPVARLVRGEFLILKELEYYQGARALGAGPVRLIGRHLLPNALTPIIVSATLRVGTTILVEAALSFLGLGVQPPTPSWGNIVLDSRENIFSEPWIPLSAGLAIVITVVGYNLLGDGLRDALDPRLRD